MNDKLELAQLLQRLGAQPISDDEYLRMRSALIAAHSSIEVDALEKAELGLEQEAIFALLSKLIGTTTSITPLDQKPLVRGDEISPDLLVGFKPNCTISRVSNEKFEEFNCLVEVKATSKDSFRYKGAGLRRRRNFAARFNLPLLFAVRFMKFDHAAIWAIVKDDPAKADIRIDIGSLDSGCRKVLWDDYWLLINPTCVVEVDFVEEDPTGELMRHPFGFLQRVCFRMTKHQVEIAGVEAGLYWIIALAYNPVFSDPQISNGKTTVFMSMADRMHSIADLVFALNWIPWRQGGSARVTATLESRAPGGPFFDRQLVESLLVPLMNLDGPTEERVLLLFGVGDPKDHLAEWKELGRVA